MHVPTYHLALHIHGPRFTTTFLGTPKPGWHTYGCPKLGKKRRNLQKMQKKQILRIECDMQQPFAGQNIQHIVNVN